MTTEEQALADEDGGSDPELTDALRSFREVVGRLGAPPLRMSQNALARSMGITSGYLSQILNPKDPGAVRVDAVGRAVERARQELERRAGAPEVPADLIGDLRDELRRLSAVFPYTASRRAGAPRPTVGIVVAGGTISLAYDAVGQRSFHPPADQLEEHFAQETRGVANLEFLYPAWPSPPGNSVDLTPAHWADLARTIYGALEDPDLVGVVVAHGLDTMTFTATAVAFALGDIYAPGPHQTPTAMLPKPVVFTGSQYPWRVPNSDAERNLKTACMVASSCDVDRDPASGQLCTVLLCMDNTVLSPAHTLMSVHQRMTQFVPLGYAVALLNGNQILYTLRSARLPNTVPSSWREPDFGAPIRVVQPLPGDELWTGSALHRTSFATWLEPEPGHGLAAVALIAQGSGAVPLSPDHSTRELLTEAARLDIPVFVGSATPTFEEPPDADAVTVELTNLGATPMPRRTTAHLIVKLRWAASVPRPADASWRTTVINRMNRRHPAESIERSLEL